MRYKKLKLCTVLLFGIGLSGIQGQTLYVLETSGTQTPYALSSISKLTFSVGNIVVSKTDGTSDTYSLTSIRYLNFSDLTTGILNANIQETDDMLLYPNPVNDIITINYPSSCEALQIDIFATDGKVVYQQILDTSSGTSQTNIDVSKLPKGMYLCRLSNGTTLTTNKFLKD